MLDSGLPRKSDVMTTCMVAGAPRTDDLLILVAPPRVQSTYDGGRSVAVIFMISCRDVEMGDLCPATPKRGAREEERKKDVCTSSQSALVQEIGIGRQ